MELCTTCNSQKILKEKELVCIFCTGKKQGVAKEGYVAPIDPGEKGLADLLGNGHVAQIKRTAPIVKPTKPTLGNAQTALEIMNNLPMPNDIKQFKQIKKIIKQLEILVGEQNGK